MRGASGNPIVAGSMRLSALIAVVLWVVDTFTTVS